jgi:hypothetical protein
MSTPTLLTLLISILCLISSSLYLVGCAAPWLVLTFSVPIPNIRAGTWSGSLMLTRFEASVSSLTNPAKVVGMTTDLSRVFETWSTTNAATGSIYNTPDWSASAQSAALGSGMAFLVFGAVAGVIAGALGLFAGSSFTQAAGPSSIIMASGLCFLFGLIGTASAAPTMAAAMSILKAFATADVNIPGVTILLASFLTANIANINAYTAFVILSGLPGFGSPSYAPGFICAITGTVISFLTCILAIISVIIFRKIEDNNTRAFGSSDIVTYMSESARTRAQAATRLGEKGGVQAQHAINTAGSSSISAYDDVVITPIPSRFNHYSPGISPSNHEMLASYEQARNRASQAAANAAALAFDNEVLYSASVRRSGGSPRFAEDVVPYASPDMERRW